MCVCVCVLTAKRWMRTHMHAHPHTPTHRATSLGAAPMEETGEETEEWTGLDPPASCGQLELG